MRRWILLMTKIYEVYLRELRSKYECDMLVRYHDKFFFNKNDTEKYLDHIMNGVEIDENDREVFLRKDYYECVLREHEIN